MLNLVANGPSGYNINNSLRFRSSASASLTRTPASTTNQTTWTWSSWVKRGTLGAIQSIFASAVSTAGFNECRIDFTSSDTFELFFQNGSALAAQLITTQVFRDPSAWYHIVVVSDTTQATSTNRLKVYVNGSQVTSFGTATYPAQNATFQFNKNVLHTIGAGFTTATQTSPNAYFTDGYLTEVNFIDGQALTPSSFGSTNSTTGVWQPAKYTGTYGTNGFYLNFNSIALTSGSNTGLGKDNSGNGNYWNTNNISVTTGATYDAMTDVPTLTSATVANYCVLNPLDNGGLTISQANMSISRATTSWVADRATIGISSGKWYWEYTSGASGSAFEWIGIGNSNATLANYVGVDANGYAYNSFTGNKINSNSGAGSGVAYGATYTAGDVIGVALDMDAGTITFYKNNTSQGTAYTGLSSTFFPMFSQYGTLTGYANFGQRPFTYTPPTGFNALNTYNLPTSTIVQGNKYMDATLYTGNSSTQSITNTAGFKPDFVWAKMRGSATQSHALFDSVRGVGNYLSSDSTSAELTQATSLTAFNSNGFSLGAFGLPNLSTYSYVGWQWQAGQGSSGSNTNGSITSTVSVNASAGFSIATFTCPASGSFTIGHGLGVTPAMVIVKGRQSVNQWYTWHKSLNNNAPSNTYYVNLSSTAAQATLANMWGTTGMTSSTVGLNATSASVVANENYVAYCWAEIAGFSKFGSYTGNGSTDGPFVYLGFRPKYVMIKSSSNTGNWVVLDASRNLYNNTNAYLNPNTSNAEANTGTLDFLSNGFKFRSVDYNDSGYTFIYAAFAENPFKNALAR